MEVVSDGKVLANSQVGASGDFAAILDDPLAPGDYQIVLRIVGENGVVSQSDEVATVSVPPKGEPDALFVMVTKPGEASRILTQPEVKDDIPGEQTVAMADREPAADGSSDSALAGQKTEEPIADTDTQVTALVREMPSKQDAVQPEAEENRQTTPAPPTDEQTGSSRESEADDAQVEVATQDSEAPRSQEQFAQATGVGEATPAISEPEVRGAASDESEQRLPLVPPDVNLRIDAVEVESGRIFVAGSATLGGLVRVFVDDEEIGSHDVSSTGRFLVEADRDIAVGPHIIRADLIMPGDSRAVMGVSVPFVRPEGQLVAAVAPPPPPDTSVASEATEQNEELAPEAVQTAEASDDISDEAPETPASDATQLQPLTVVQEPLEPRDRSVIIRRGDTLWQISRRIYGRGVRYTTIYFANTEHIDHPDWIEPGQIFSVPEEHHENAEEIHRQLLRDLD